MDTKAVLRTQEEFKELEFSLDERLVRLWCAAKARAYNREYGRGGVSMVFYATGVWIPADGQCLGSLYRLKGLFCPFLGMHRTAFLLVCQLLFNVSTHFNRVLIIGSQRLKKIRLTND